MTDGSARVRPLTAGEVESYRRDGFVHLPTLIDGRNVARLLAACDARMQRPGRYGTNMTTDGLFFQDRDMHRDEPMLHDFVTLSGMGELAARAMGSREVRFYFDHLFALGPNSAKDQYYWHQDLPYWACSGWQVCSCWLALTDCASDSGALEFVRGTDSGPLYSPVRFGDAPGSQVGEQPAARPPAYHEHRDVYEIVTWDIRAGDAVLFNARVMHSSRGNHSKTQRRVAYSTRWVGDDVVFEVKPDFQDPVTLPEEGFPAGEKLSKSSKFSLVRRNDEGVPG